MRGGCGTTTPLGGGRLHDLMARVLPFARDFESHSCFLRVTLKHRQKGSQHVPYRGHVACPFGRAIQLFVGGAVFGKGRFGAAGAGDLVCTGTRPVRVTNVTPQAV
jgi:hypothetical protein